VGKGLRIYRRWASKQGHGWSPLISEGRLWGRYLGHCPTTASMDGGVMRHRRFCKPSNAGLHRFQLGAKAIIPDLLNSRLNSNTPPWRRPLLAAGE